MARNPWGRSGKPKEAPTAQFVRRWQDTLTASQVEAVLAAYGQKVDQIAEVSLAVKLKNGDIEILQAPGQ